MVSWGGVGSDNIPDGVGRGTVESWNIMYSQLGDEVYLVIYQMRA